MEKNLQLKIAICDDEPIFGRLLQECVETFLEENTVEYQVTVFASGEEFLEQGERIADYTVVFLDICMDGIDGMKVAERLRMVSKKAYLVFVTAFLDFATIGYKYQAFRYILKNTNQMKDAIEECMEAVLKDSKLFSAGKVFEFVDGKKRILLDKILYLESREHKVYFNLSNEKQVYVTYDTLDQLTIALQSYDFVRVHRSYLVNLKYVKNYRRFELFLTDVTWIPIPKGRYKEVKQRIERYKGDSGYV